MFFTFPLLILTVSTLLVYFTYKNETSKKIDDMTTDLLRANEEKTNIEVKYNKILNDMKKLEDLKKGKNLDEMQLLFTKVNMLDDKLTFFNTSFKNKLDVITSLLERNIAQAESLLKTPRVDLDEQNIDEFEKFEEDTDNTDLDNDFVAEEDANEDANTLETQTQNSLENAEEDYSIEEKSAINESPIIEKEPVVEDNSVAEDNSVIEEEPIAKEEPVVEEQSSVKTDIDNMVAEENLPANDIPESNDEIFEDNNIIENNSGTVAKNNSETIANYNGLDNNLTNAKNNLNDASLELDNNVSNSADSSISETNNNDLQLNNTLTAKEDVLNNNIKVEEINIADIQQTEPADKPVEFVDSKSVESVNDKPVESIHDEPVEIMNNKQESTDVPVMPDLNIVDNSAIDNKISTTADVENLDVDKDLDLNKPIDFDGVANPENDSLLNDLSVPTLDNNDSSSSINMDNSVKSPVETPIEDSVADLNIGINDISNKTEAVDLNVQNVLDNQTTLEEHNVVNENHVESNNIAKTVVDNNISKSVDSALPATDLSDKQSTLKGQIDVANIMYQKQEQINADVAKNTVDMTKNTIVKEQPSINNTVVNTAKTVNTITNNIEDQVQPFDNSAQYDIDVLNTDFNNNDLVNNTAEQEEIKNDLQTDIMSDAELNSALKELDDINFELSEENEVVDNNIAQPSVQNKNAQVANSGLNDLERDLDVDELHNISESVNMQNDIEKHEKDVNNNLEPAMDGSIDNDELDSNDEDFFSSLFPDDAADTEQHVNNDSGFDIKASIEKLKAQLDDNKDENK